MIDSGPVLAAMERWGSRLTAPRRALASLIVEQPGHFTAAELARLARQRRLDIGRATIFRTLDLLSEVGVVERIDLPTGDHAYVACVPAHHHHIVCSRCGGSLEVADAGLGRLVRDIERSTGYRVERHRLELFGRCPTCQTTEPDA